MRAPSIVWLCLLDIDSFFLLFLDETNAGTVQEMIEEADRDQDGVVNADEFYRVMRKREDPLDDLDSDDEY